MEKMLPSFISLNITNECNAKCRHCNSWRLKDSFHPEVSHWLKVVDDLAAWLGRPAVIVAGGEPLLEEATLPILERCAVYGMPTNLATNGFLVDEGIAASLGRAKLTSVNISIDGFDHTHDRIRNHPGAFEQALKAASLLRANGIRVNATCVIMEDNLDQITGLIDFLMKGDHVEGIFFQAMAQPFGTNIQKPGWWKTHPLFPKDPKRAQDLLDELLSMKQNGFFILNEDFQFPALKAYFAGPDRFTLAQCTVGQNGVTVSAAGDVCLCVFKEPAGNITRDGIREILESDKANQLRDEMASCTENCHLLINCCFDPSQLITPEGVK